MKAFYFKPVYTLAAFLLLTLMISACASGGAEQPQSSGGVEATQGGIQYQGQPAEYVYSGPAPASGTGNVAGRLLWNGQAVIGVPVKLCEEIDYLSGCSGVGFDATTDNSGVYVFSNVTPNTYGLTFHSLDSDDWVYLTSGLLDASEFEVTADQTLNIGDTDVVRYDMKQVSPAEDTQVSEARPQLEWEAYEGADYYEIVMNSDRGSSIFSFDRVDGTSISPAQDLLTCNYSWYVRAFNAGGVQIGETDGFWHFEETGQPNDCYVTGLNPADGASASASGLTLNWNAHPLAAYYEVDLYNADDTSVEPLEYVRADSNAYNVTQNIDPGTYYWSVYAYDQSGNLFAYSDTYTLVIQ
jgi:hypothetical protein